MEKILTIRIPYQLAIFAAAQREKVNVYETNQIIKALDLWLVLKADAPGSYIQQWNNQKQSLVQLGKCSETIFRHRLRILSGLKLLSFDRNNIRLCSWDQLDKILEIDSSEKFTIQYSINDKKKIFQWILATEIKENQSRQAYSILKKVKKIPEIQIELIAELIKQGANRERLNDPDYFLAMLKAAYFSDFVKATEIHDILIQIRPDTNRGVKKMAAAWKARHPMTATYWQRVLQKAGIIDIGKMQLQSTERVRNDYCKVLWLKKPMETLLCLCNQITILEPWKILNFSAK